MRSTIWAVVVWGVMNSGASAATLYLSSADGKDHLFFLSGDHGTMQIRLDTTAADTVKVAFIGAFLDAEGMFGGSSLALLDLVEGQGDPWIYDRSAFTVPGALVSDPGGNEYGLIMGDQTVDGGFPLGTATWVLDSLELYDPAIDVYDVTFEPGVRQPTAYGPSPTYTPFTLAPDCLSGGIPNLLYLGNGNPGPLCGDPFHVDTGTPEPGSALLVLTAVGLAAAGRKKPAVPLPFSVEAGSDARRRRRGLPRLRGRGIDRC